MRHQVAEPEECSGSTIPVEHEPVPAKQYRFVRLRFRRFHCNTHNRNSLVLTWPGQIAPYGTKIPRFPPKQPHFQDVAARKSITGCVPYECDESKSLR